MKVIKILSVNLGLLLGSYAAAQGAQPQLPMPPGIGIRLTIEGPVFVDPQGMTLYMIRLGLGGAGGTLETCDDTRHTMRTGFGGHDFPLTVPDVETRRTCVEKRPPLYAPADARPIGKWRIHIREDQSRQWSYDGNPLYTSIKDKAPGESNGNDPDNLTYPWILASAPLANTPAGITVTKTSVGLALTNYKREMLYYQDDGLTASSLLWQPLVAPALANADQLPDWSIVNRKDGLKQWAYKGEPLYRYADDAVAHDQQIFNDIFGNPYGQAVEGWHVALLKEAPAHPAEVTVQVVAGGDNRFKSRKIYANISGMTLYTMHCFEGNTVDKLDCDDVGDSTSHWLSFCGEEKRCAETWRPLAAPTDATPIDDVWSVVIINSRHPWKSVDKPDQGIRVWAYRGRPVFTYAHDPGPGYYSGEPDGSGQHSVMVARTIPAFVSNIGS